MTLTTAVVAGHGTEEEIIEKHEEGGYLDMGRLLGIILDQEVTLDVYIPFLELREASLLASCKRRWSHLL